MKSLIIGLMLISSVATAEPYKRPLDSDNPYYPPSAYYQPGYDHNPEYLKARLQVAEVCQDLRYYLSHHHNPEMEALMGDCNVDSMEWYAIETCQKNEISLSECPVAELLFLDVGILRAYLTR